MGVKKKEQLWFATIVAVCVVGVVAWWNIGSSPTTNVSHSSNPDVTPTDASKKLSGEDDWKSFFRVFKLCSGLEYSYVQSYVQSNPVYDENVLQFSDREYFSRVAGEELLGDKPVWRFEVEVSTLWGEHLVRNVVWVYKENNKCLKQVVIGPGGVREVECNPFGYTAWQVLANQVDTLWKTVGKETLVFDGKTVEAELIEVYRLGKLRAKLWVTRRLSVPLMIEFYLESGEPHTVMRLESYKGCGEKNPV